MMVLCKVRIFGRLRAKSTTPTPFIYTFALARSTLLMS